MDKVTRVEKTTYELVADQDAIVKSGGVKVADHLAPPQEAEPLWHEFSPSADEPVGGATAPISPTEANDAQWDDGVSWMAERKWSAPEDFTEMVQRVRHNRVARAHDALLDIKPDTPMKVVDGMPAPVAEFQFARNAETSSPVPDPKVYVEGTRAVVMNDKGTVREVFVPVDTSRVATSKTPVSGGKGTPQDSDALWSMVEVPAPMSPPAPTYKDRLKKIWEDVVSLVVDFINEL